MIEEQQTPKDRLRIEINTHLYHLQDRVLGLLAARDPFSVYNEIPALRSIIGQLDSASKRYREIA